MIFYENSSYLWSKDFQSQWKSPLLVEAVNAFSHMHVLNPYKLSEIRLSFTGTSTIRFCVKNNLLLYIYIIILCHLMFYMMLLDSSITKENKFSLFFSSHD